MGNLQTHSPFITFTRKDDLFRAEAADLTAPGISFLRVEMARVRIGMADYLMKVSTPKTSAGKSNTIVTLRGNRRQASGSGLLSTAKVIIKEMKARGDETTNWDAINPDQLARMLAPSLKYFATNANAVSLAFETEALV